MPRHPVWVDDMISRDASKLRVVLPILGALALLPSNAQAQGAGLGVEHIGASGRHGQAYVGAEHRDVGALRRDSQGGALGVDAAFDRDLATAEAALHVAVAGQPAQGNNTASLGHVVDHRTQRCRRHR